MLVCMSPDVLRLHAKWGEVALRSGAARRQSTIKRDNRIMWYDSMQNAIKQTIIISEILDTRTRHLIQVCLTSYTSRSHIKQLALKSPRFQCMTLPRPALLTHALTFPPKLARIIARIIWFCAALQECIQNIDAVKACSLCGGAMLA